MGKNAKKNAKNIVCVLGVMDQCWRWGACGRRAGAGHTSPGQWAQRYTDTLLMSACTTAFMSTMSVSTLCSGIYNIYTPWCGPRRPETRRLLRAAAENPHHSHFTFSPSSKSEMTNSILQKSQSQNSQRSWILSPNCEKQF